MKKFFFSLLLLCSFSFVFGQDYSASFRQPETNTYQVTFDIKNWNLQNVTLDGNTYSQIIFSSSVTTEQKGWAELPKISASIQLPARKDVDYIITKSEYRDIVLDNPLVPSRGVIYRNQDPNTIPYIIAPESMIDEFYPGNIVSLDAPYILRDVRGTSIRVQPFQYNAVTNTLRVYSMIEVTMTEKDGPATNPLLKENLTPVKESIGMYESIFMNFDKSRYDLPMAQYGEILVICTSRDEAGIEPWIQWKKEKGFNVSKEVVPTGTNVKSIIKNKYDENNNILYVQLVGDWADIKCDADVANSPTDPSMGCVVGNDNMPDIAIGRFSCSNDVELATQVNKSIDYEKSPNMDAGWREITIGVASMEGPGDDGEKDFQHIDNIYNNKLEPFTYETFATNYEPNASSALLTTQLNSGASNLMYCGHGSHTSFGTTGFNNSNISQLNNGEMLPFITACACVVGAFHKTGGDCFAEAWLKKQNGGAVLTWMSTINQPWQPPMRGQDYFYDILIGGYDYSLYPTQNGITTTEQRTTWGAITVNALNLMLTESSSYSDIETVKTWTTFGDVSLELRTKKPAELVLSNNVVLIGTNFETIITANGNPVKDALVCISQGDNYYTAFSDENGSVSIENELIPGSCLLVVTAFNTTTYYETITCASPEGAFIIADNYTLDGDGILENGETANITLAMKNVGAQASTGNTTVTLSCENPDITFPVATTSYGPIPQGQSLTIENGFKVSAANNVANGTSYPVKVTATNGSDTWESTIVINVNSPVIVFNGVTWPGSFDPGMTFNIGVNYKNNGGASAKNSKVTLTIDNPEITIAQQEYNIGTIAPEGIGVGIFSVSLSNNILETDVLEFTATFTADKDIILTDNISLSNSCNLVFDLFDSYGDGWNGNARLVVSFDDGTPDQIIRLESGSQGQEILKVNSGTNITLTWFPGTYFNQENSFKVYYEYDPDNILLEISNPPSGELLSFVAECGGGAQDIVEPVTNLTVEVDDNNHVILTWEHPNTNEIDNYIINRNGVTLGTVNVTNYTDQTTEPNNTYQYCIIAVKDNDESIPECIQVIIEEEEEEINPVRNLTGQAEGTVVTLNWDYPEGYTPGGTGETHELTWAGPADNNAIGTDGVADFDVANRFEVSDLTNYVGWTLKTIKFYPAEQQCEYSLRAWTGDNAADLVLDQVVANPIIGGETSIDVESNVVIEAGKEFWIGYRCNTQKGFPAGVDAGPAVAGKGDMVYSGGAWASIGSMGLNYNFVIIGVIQNAKGETANLVLNDNTNRPSTGMLSANYSPIVRAPEATRGLEGYKIYLDNEVIATINDPKIKTFVDDFSFNTKEDIVATYCISALYTSEESTKECVEVVILGIQDIDGITLYPNPAKDIVRISGVNVQKVYVYNSLGQLIDEVSTNEINVSNYAAGMYMMNVITTDGKINTVKVFVEK